LPFIPADQLLPDGQYVTQAPTISTNGYASSDRYQDHLESQLKYEREQHATTRYQLQCEQEKLRKAQSELDNSKRQASSLIASNRLNSEILAVTLHRIEPKVDKIGKAANLFSSLSGVAHHNVVEAGVDVEDHLSEAAHPFRPELSLPAGPLSSSSSSSPNIDTERPSILYDVLAGRRKHDLDRSSGFHSASQQNMQHDTNRQDDIRKLEKVEQEQNMMHSPSQKARGLRDNDVRLLDCLDETDSWCPDPNEFDSLDEAFESDFFPKSAQGTTPNHHSPEKKKCDGMLVDILPATSLPPDPTFVNHDHTDNKLAKAEEHKSSKKDNSFTALEVSVGLKTNSTNLEPNLGVHTVG
jgi:hypothetical protein